MGQVVCWRFQIQTIESNQQEFKHKIYTHLRFKQLVIKLKPAQVYDSWQGVEEGYKLMPLDSEADVFKN